MTTRYSDDLLPIAQLTRGRLASRAVAKRGDEARARVDVERLWARLRRDVEGEVRFDAGSLGLYAQDASNYFHVPLGVVLPKSAQDVVATVSACRELLEVLEHLGFDVEIPARVLCCGRPLYDYGMLDRAKGYLEDVLAELRPYVTAGTPLVVLEPSCCAVFRDEMPALLPNRVEAENLRRQTFLFSEFLAQRAKQALPLLRRSAIVQGHCHHKSVLEFEHERASLRAMQLDARVLDSGCCGMAGSFGFEAEKYGISTACGERVLLPEVRRQSTQTLVIANGFSCRTQIAQATGREALHLAEVMKLALDYGPAGPPVDRAPEFSIVSARQRALRRGRVKVALRGALVLSMVCAALWAHRRLRAARA